MMNGDMFKCFLNSESLHPLLVRKGKIMSVILLFRFCSVIFLGILANPMYAQKTEASVVTTILGRLQNYLSANIQNADEIKGIINSMQADGSWKGIDYSSTRVSGWPPIHHLSEYVLPMARAYSNDKSPLFHNKELGIAIHKSLDFWLHHNFTSQNWWANEIGVPNALTDIFILMNPDFTEDELLQALNQMRGSGIDQTGQNRVWRAEIQLKIGLLSYGKGRTNMLGSPAERMSKASEILRQEVVVRDQEGIQPDWSFHQHGIQQQFGNYGLAFASTQAKWAFILANTPYGYDEQKLAILRNYILNGLSRVVWKGVMDISGCGRQLFVNSAAEKGSDVLKVLSLMAKADPEYAKTYQQAQLFNNGTAPQPDFLKQNTYFWRSDLMVNRNENSYVSVRMCSRVIQSTESGNGENLLGAYLSDGATYVYRSGKEYGNIFPVWDWHRIPGVTSYTKSDLPTLSWQGLHNQSDFVGGVSDSASGIACMLFKRDGLLAYKSWFFTPQGLVCLGTGIHSDLKEDVSTTVNQNLLNGRIIVKTNKGTRLISEGEQLKGENISWVYHDRTGYLFLQKGKVEVSADHQSGNWNRVYHAGSSQEISKNVFNLSVDHGSNPMNESYAYMVLPNTSESMLNHALRIPLIKILQNDTCIQAVSDASRFLTQMIFYREGKISLNKKTVLRANNPCLVIAQQSGNNLKITVSTPPEIEKEVVLSLNGQYQCADCIYNSDNDETKVKFHKLNGADAGKSISQILIPR